MTKVLLLHPVEHDGQRYEAGSHFEGDDEVVRDLVAAGAARDPKAKKEEAGKSSDSDLEAMAIVDDAKADAEKIHADAAAKAESIVSDAKSAAEKIKADAKADAEKIVKDAQDAAAKAKTPAQNK